VVDQLGEADKPCKVLAGETHGHDVVNLALLEQLLKQHGSGIPPSPPEEQPGLR